MTTWEERQVLESEAEKIRANAELNRTTPEYMRAALESELVRQTGNKEDYKTRRRSLAVARFLKGVVLVCGRSLLVHITWAAAIVAVAWILTVYGWRGV